MHGEPQQDVNTEEAIDVQAHGPHHTQHLWGRMRCTVCHRVMREKE